jgi:8-oxo-dGTP pyrophosphatase MutT (NUDIX family)
MGDFHPEAHIKGFSGVNLTALICNKKSAIFDAVVSNLLKQMYKVFINDLTLIIISKSETDYLLLWPAAKVLDGVEVTPNDVLLEAEKGKDSHLVLVAANADKFFDSFKSNFNVLEAAGGIVNLINRKGPFLMIHRNGKWDLPKGKIEKNESKKDAGIREVSEECGIGSLTIRNHYDTTYHTYIYKDKRFLKITYWYRMITTDMSTPEPQASEGIDKAQWVNLDDIPFLLKDSYQSIKNLMAPLING